MFKKAGKALLNNKNLLKLWITLCIMLIKYLFKETIFCTVQFE